MKKIVPHLLMFGLAAAILVPTRAADDAPPAASQSSATETNAVRQSREVRQARRAERQAARRETRRQSAALQAEGTTNAPLAAQQDPAPPPVGPPAEPEEANLRLNFRGVALDVVLDYLSEAAGYTIVLETPVKGTVDVWSNQPLTKSEALNLLNTVLNKNGYAAIQNDKTLTVVSRDEAKKRDVPLRIGAASQAIPKNEQIVTQVIPVRNINVAQLSRDLAPLIPSTATVVANEGANTLLMTDTQSNIHRFAEIIAALDSQVSSASSIRVYPLRYADAKALAATITSLFQNSNASTGGNAGGNAGGGRGGFPGFGGQGGFPGAPGGFGGGGGGRGGGGTASSANAVATATRVNAVADEHSNSVIVSAPETQLAGIELLIKSVDTDVQDLTEVRVFHLKNADPVEMSELLVELFPDTTQQDETRGGGVRFGGGFGFPGAGGGRATAATSVTERSKKMGKVISAADSRTGSLVVSAARELMPQISEMVMQLDSDPSKKKKVFVYDLENANVQEVETVLRQLFETQNTRGNSSSLQNNALQNRANQANQNQGTGAARTGAGGTGLGGGGGLGGTR